MGKRMTITSANGVKGMLLNPYTSDGKWIFRVYNIDIGDGSYNFTDYDLNHSDLSIVIDDPDAFFYHDGEEISVLDHSPNTLGIIKD